MVFRLLDGKGVQVYSEGGDRYAWGYGHRFMKSVVRILRAPFFLISLGLSLLPVFFVFASVSVGAWCEDALRLLGYRSKYGWLPALLGFVGYTGLGVAGPAYLGNVLIGWPGAILGPLIALGVIAVLGRW